MADNAELNAGSGGITLATDDVGGIHYQIVKQAYGALDTAVLAIAGAGNVTTGTPRMTLAADDPAVVDLAAIEVLLTTLNGLVDGLETLIGTTNTNTGGAATSLAIVDDWDNTASDGASVSGDVAHDGVDAGEPVKVGGYASAAAPTGVSADADRVNAWFLRNGAQATVVTAAGALIGGDAANGLDVDVTRVGGTVAVTQSGTWDEVGINDSGNSITVDWAGTAPPIGAGLEATALRVTLATDSTGVVSIDDNGGAITVDGTVAVTSAGITTIAGAVSGTEMQVDVVAALPAGTNAIGKLAANSGVDIGDVDILSIAAGTNSIGNVGLVPRTTGGMTIFNSIDLDESEEEIKSSAGQIFSISAFNTTAAPLWLRFYNATAANTTVGTTAAHMGPFLVPGNADSDGAGFVWNNTIGAAFGTAISAAVTTGVAAADTGAPGANACVVVVGYV